MTGFRGPSVSRRRLLQAMPAPVVGAAMAGRAVGGAEAPARPVEPAHRCGFWVDLYSGEPVGDDELLEDLKAVRVVYLGERHGVRRHHDLEAWVVGQLAKRSAPLVLGLEPMEAIHQATLDRYAAGEVSFEQLVEATQWAKRWPGYAQYKPVLEAARQTQSPILALNARAEIVRHVARSGGVEKLDAAIRRQLPADMQLQDPAYEKLLNLRMMVHMAATPQRLRPMIEAQMVRDETMASVLASFLQSPAGQRRTAVVVCGAGHVDYGLGTAARVRRRMPGVKDRIVLFSESGDVELSPQEQAMARPIAITHEQLRGLARPIADYLHVTSIRPRP